MRESAIDIVTGERTSVNVLLQESTGTWGHVAGSLVNACQPMIK